MTFNQEDLVEIFSKLDERCWSCKDEGAPTMKRADGECDVCNGTERQLTEAGDELLNFLRRWGIEGKR